MIFRKARVEDADKLTQLTLESKRYWDYPEAWITLWKDELHVSAEYIQENMVMIAEENSELVGYISIINELNSHIVEIEGTKIAGGFFLDNLFIHPSYIRKGIGKKLVALAFDWCKENGIEKLFVSSDPNAKGFYEKMGAICLGELPSKIEGRTLYFYVFNLDV
jgi:Predicted acetyltransferase